jgi:hypothetical protein
MSSRPIAALASVFVLMAAGRGTSAQAPGRLRPLDRALAEYAAGDRGAIARTFSRSLDFQKERLINRGRVARLLNGPWQRSKAAFLLELGYQASQVAPAYSIPLLTAGRDYLARNPTPPGSSPADDRFERLWHAAAIGIFQQRYLWTTVDEYLSAVQKSRPVRDAELAARLRFARGVAQEQRCWLERPVLLRVGTPVVELNRASRAGGGGRPRPAGDVSPDVSRRLDCLAAASEHYAAATAGEAAAEARVRLAWVQYQLGMFPEARASLAGIDPGNDRDLRYWTALFRARIAGALEQPDEAVREYRLALEIAPRAQTAGVGLALALFLTDRIDEANAASRAVRSAPDDAADPWWRYLTGDGRFVEAWIAELRSLL